jgi:hypothetical protein
MADSPNPTVYVLIARWQDGSGEAEVIGVYWSRARAQAVIDLIEKASPSKQLIILEGELNQS